LEDRGKIILFYALFKLKNGGYGFEVMSRADIDAHAQTYSKAFTSSFSPWKTDYESMAKKTVIKKLLKYAPLKTDFLRALNSDESIKSELAVDMTEVQNDDIIDGECKDIDNTNVDTPV
jgi:recombination protein RecT